MERWLDAGSGSCVLRHSEARRIVADSLAYFEAERYVHHAWVIMPNHVHTLTSLHPEWEMDKVLQSWKGYSALEINRQRGIQGTFWQEDYFNRLIRDRDHFVNVLRYIRRNPSTAHLKDDEFTSYESPGLASW